MKPRILPTTLALGLLISGCMALSNQQPDQLTDPEIKTGCDSTHSSDPIPN